MCLAIADAEAASARFCSSCSRLLAATPSAGVSEEDLCWCLKPFFCELPARCDSHVFPRTGDRERFPDNILVKLHGITPSDFLRAASEESVVVGDSSAAIVVPFRLPSRESTEPSEEDACCGEGVEAEVTEVVLVPPQRPRRSARDSGLIGFEDTSFDNGAENRDGDVERGERSR